MIKKGWSLFGFLFIFVFAVVLLSQSANARSISSKPCSSYTYAAICDTFENCYWDGTKCEAYDFSDAVSTSDSAGKSKFGGVMSWLPQWDNWFGTNTADPVQRAQLGSSLKWLLWILVFLIVYSAFAYSEFPQSFFLRLILAIVVSFLATFMISTDEILASLDSYTALGLALWAGLPILVLVFFTILVASKGDPIGIYAQKIVWLAYSVFLFFRAMKVFLVQLLIQDWRGIAVGYNVPDTKMVISSVMNQNAWVPWLQPEGIPTATGIGGYYVPDWVRDFLQRLLPNNQEGIDSLAQADITTAMVLLILAIAVFVVMVLGNEYVERWLQSARLQSEIDSYRMKLQRAGSKQSMDAEAMRLGGKPR